MKSALLVALVALAALAVGLYVGRSSSPPATGWSRLTDGRFVESAEPPGSIVVWTIKDGKPTEARRYDARTRYTHETGYHFVERVYLPDPNPPLD